MVSEDNNTIAILGAGELGHAIAHLLKNKGLAARLWDADASKVPEQGSLKEHVSSADFLFLCIPSWTIRVALRDVRPFLKSAAIVVSFAKGIEEESCKTMGELLPDLLPENQRYAIIGGPMLAQEISSDMASVCAIASPDGVVRNTLHDIFSSSQCRVERYDDAHGVSLAGVLKNIYSVALGIADGLALSGNQKGWLAACAIQEMLAMGETLGVRSEIILGTPGVGDFIATGYSPYSLNRAVGNEIVKNGVGSLRGEGLNSLPSLIARLGKRSSVFPLLHLIHGIGVECKPAASAFQVFFNEER